jgi:hypothetical protein
MFKFIGGFVVCGFALYGLVKLVERPMIEVVVNPTAFKDPDVGGSAAMESQAEAAASETATNDAPRAVD